MGTGAAAHKFAAIKTKHLLRQFANVQKYLNHTVKVKRFPYNNTWHIYTQTMHEKLALLLCWQSAASTKMPDYVAVVSGSTCLATICIPMASRPVGILVNDFRPSVAQSEPLEAIYLLNLRLTAL